MSKLNDPRVLFAAERTLLAWNRTSLGFIAFGFVLERAGLLLSVFQESLSQEAHQASTFLLGICFILLGASCAAISSYQFSVVLNTLTEAEFPKGYYPKWGLWVNILVAFLGTTLVIVLYMEQH